MKVPLALFLTLSACSASDKAEMADVQGPDRIVDTGMETPLGWFPADEEGPYTAGTASLDFVGRSGVEMKVQVWYPSVENNDWLHRYDGLISWNAVDTPEPDCREKRPVLAFSHGNQGVRWQSPFLVERLASHGFVVVAPGHTGNTTLDYERERLAELVFRRPHDIADAVDWLFDQAPNEILGLGDCLDSDSGYAVSGHSFGGYTATAVGGAEFDHVAIESYCSSVGGWLCSEYAEYIAEHPEYLTADFADPRVWASIPMAPAGFELVGAGAHLADVPFLVLGAEKDRATPMNTQVEPIYSALGSVDKTMGMVVDGGHMVFANTCEILANLIVECGGDYADYEIAHPTIATTVVAWLQLQLGYAEAEVHMPFESDLWEWTQP